MLLPPPPIDGVSASRVQLPPAPCATLLDGLHALFPGIGRQVWAARFVRGRILDTAGGALAADAPYRTGLEVYYYREVLDEGRLPGAESVLHVDAHLVVADKPHGLPVTPAGGFVAETLLARLVRRLGNPQLVPLHRIDRDTAGLVLFSADPGTRSRYHALFRDRRIAKDYEALARPRPELVFPRVRESRMVLGEPFFRMREVPGEPNSETRIDVLERGTDRWRYGLTPVTGRKHQLRVHMAALGAPILNDALYPVLAEAGRQDPGQPLQLLAKRLRFVDPLDGRPRMYESGFDLGFDLAGRESGAGALQGGASGQP